MAESVDPGLIPEFIKLSYGYTDPSTMEDLKQKCLLCLILSQSVHYIKFLEKDKSRELVNTKDVFSDMKT